MNDISHFPQKQPIPLDNLPDERIAAAFALLYYGVRRLGITSFVEGGYSSQAAIDLHRAGIIRLRPARVDGVLVFEVEGR